MEIILRCSLPDRPGALAALAGAIGSAGGDIQAVEVVEHVDDRALDDLVVVVERESVAALLEAVRAVDGIELVHAGPSRGHPADAVTRLAIAVEASLAGAMVTEDTVRTLIGGLLRATEVEFLSANPWPRGDDCTLVLAYGSGALVARRAYRFTHTERERAQALLRLCETIDATGHSTAPPSGVGSVGSGGRGAAGLGSSGLG